MRLDTRLLLCACATPLTLRVLQISSIKDAAKFMREHEDIFVQKTKDVTIMGGVKPFDSDTDDGMLLQPDTAQNNTFSMEDAEYLYRRCQELGVPLVILTRHSAYRCAMPRSVYDRMARTGGRWGHLQHLPPLRPPHRHLGPAPLGHCRRA